MSFWKKKNKSIPPELSIDSEAAVEKADYSEAPKEPPEKKWRFKLKRSKAVDSRAAFEEEMASEGGENSYKDGFEKEGSSPLPTPEHARDITSESDGRYSTQAPSEKEPGKAADNSVKKKKRFKGGGAEAIAVRPIRVLMGFLPEVSHKDAKEYAQGIAEKHFEQIGLAYFEAFRYKSGYVFEAHEGGAGKAFSPAIIKYFETFGEYKPGERHAVVIPTSTRMLEVERTRDGLVAIMLPEGSDTAPTDWLRPEKSMTPAINLRTSFLMAAGVVFITGVIAMLSSGALFRIQPYDVPLAAPEDRVSIASLPVSQWAKIEKVPNNSYVTAIKFENNKWLEPILVQVTEVPAVTENLPVVPAEPPNTTGGQAIGQPSPMAVTPVPPPAATQVR